MIRRGNFKLFFQTVALTFIFFSAAQPEASYAANDCDAQTPSGIISFRDFQTMINAVTDTNADGMTKICFAPGAYVIRQSTSDLSSISISGRNNFRLEGALNQPAVIFDSLMTGFGGNLKLINAQNFSMRNVTLASYNPYSDLLEVTGSSSINEISKAKFIVYGKFSQAVNLVGRSTAKLKINSIVDSEFYLIPLYGPAQSAGAAYGITSSFAEIELIKNIYLYGGGVADIGFNFQNSLVSEIDNLTASGNTAIPVGMVSSTVHLIHNCNLTSTHYGMLVTGSSHIGAVENLTIYANLNPNRNLGALAGAPAPFLLSSSGLVVQSSTIDNIRNFTVRGTDSAGGSAAVYLSASATISSMDSVVVSGTNFGFQLGSSTIRDLSRFSINALTTGIKVNGSINLLHSGVVNIPAGSNGIEISDGSSIGEQVDVSVTHH